MPSTLDRTLVTDHRPHRPRARQLAAFLLVGLAAAPQVAVAQRIVTVPQRIITIAKGASALIVNPTPIQRFSVGDPNVAEPVVVSPTELLVNAKALGGTSLFVWDSDKNQTMYAIEVRPDAENLQRYLSALFPDDSIRVSGSGNAITLSGRVRDASAADRAVEIAKGVGGTIIDNLVTAGQIQIQLQVRFAEINRSALEEFAADLAAVNPQNLDAHGDWLGASNSLSGLLRVGLLNPGGNLIDGLLKTLETKGHLRSLAEPNLLTLPGKEATFLAGGEFPYPVAQGGGQSGAVTVLFREYGVKLRFTPVLTRDGAIRLRVAPEVSALDFQNALEISGFTVPSLRTRKTETEVELFEGQYLAIAGLVDNQMFETMRKIPLIGDIPILGQLFRSKNAEQRRSELLVLVTPRIVRPSATAIPVPTGEPAGWRWENHLKGAPDRGAQPETAPR